MLLQTDTCTLEAVVKAALVLFLSGRPIGFVFLSVHLVRRYLYRAASLYIEPAAAFPAVRLAFRCGQKKAGSSWQRSRFGAWAFALARGPWREGAAGEGEGCVAMLLCMLSSTSKSRAWPRACRSATNRARSGASLSGVGVSAALPLSAWQPRGGAPS